MAHLTRRSLTLILGLTCLMAAVAGAQGGGEPPETAESVGAKAMLDLGSWKHGPVKTFLEGKQASFGTSPQFKTAWGLMLAEQGKLDDALTQLAAASTADPADPAAEYYRGEIYAWRRKADEAKAAWKKAHDRAKAQVEARPNDAEARYYFGAALIRMNKYADARTQLNLAKEKGFDRAMVHLQIAISLIFERQWDQARENLDAAIEANSGLAHAYYYRGRVWKELDRRDKMINDMDRFLRLAPDAPESDIARSLLGG